MTPHAGRIGAKKENVLIQARGCTAAIFPQPYGKIVSIRPSGHKLLQAPLDSLATGGLWSLELAPGANDSWPMIVDSETLQDVKRYA
jgi:hypothetical protein